MKILLAYIILIFFIVSNVYSQTIPSYVPTNGLVGWWPFNGNANDESGNGNNGVVNGSTLSTDRFGNANKSYEFDGKSNYISLPSLDKMQYNPVTYSLWFLDYSLVPNQNGRADGRALIGRDLCGWEKGIIPQGILLIWNEPKYAISQKLNYYTGTSGNLFNYTPQLNVWTNLTFVWNTQDTMKVYLNGVNIENKYFSSGGLNANLKFRIGAGTDGTICTSNPGRFYWDGKIDDIGVWNRALTNQEITNLYNGNLCYQYITVTDTLLINTKISSYNPIKFENTIKIFPNPAKDHITIDNGNLNTLLGYQLKISTNAGQVLFSSPINQQQFYLDISQWGGAGVYFVNIINANGVTIDTRKIVLQ